MVRGEARERFWGAFLAFLAAPTRALRYRVYCRAFAAASGIHLLLPDALEADWLAPNAAYWAGAALIAWNGCAAGWLLAAFGLAAPLLVLGDQLTQSVYLLACVTSALCCFVGPSAGRARRLEESLPAAVGTLTVGVYAIAAMHKLNSGFFDPQLSCANGGLTILADNWAIPLPSAAATAALWPPVFLIVETSVVVLLVVRPVLGMVLATAMHIPLTIVFAPSFAFTMISGWVCLLREDEVAHLLATMRRRYRLIVGVGVVLGLASFGLYLVRHWVVYLWWSFKEGLLWVLLTWLLVAWRGRPKAAGRALFRTTFPSALQGRHGRTLASVVAALWLLNALTPYTGLRYHQAGAMLSNLRIDEGCWNSALFPETVRVREPYLRIDEATARGPSAASQELEATLRDNLWNRGSLERERERACRGDVGPIAIRGTYAGAPFTVEDLCASPWPLGQPFLPRARGFQENLSRQCAQSCIH